MAPRASSLVLAHARVLGHLPVARRGARLAELRGAGVYAECVLQRLKTLAFMPAHRRVGPAQPCVQRRLVQRLQATD